MKRLHLHLPRIDVHSFDFQLSLELATGALFIALVLRWLA